MDTQVLVGFAIFLCLAIPTAVLALAWAIHNL